MRWPERMIWFIAAAASVLLVAGVFMDSQRAPAPSHGLSPEEVGELFIGDEAPEADIIFYDKDASIDDGVIWSIEHGSLAIDYDDESCNIDQLITIAYAAASGIALTDRQMETVVLCDRITKEIREGEGYGYADPTPTPTPRPLQSR